MRARLALCSGVSRAQDILPNQGPCTWWKAIDALRGIGKAVMPDVAEKHDHYLYGDPDD